MKIQKMISLIACVSIVACSATKRDPSEFLKLIEAIELQESTASRQMENTEGVDRLRAMMEMNSQVVEILDLAIEQEKFDPESTQHLISWRDALGKIVAAQSSLVQDGRSIQNITESERSELNQVYNTMVDSRGWIIEIAYSNQE